MLGDGARRRLPTGISGFDEVATGGLPAGRPTLVTGTTGSGKTLFAIEFLARGILEYGQPDSSPQEGA
jgi:circadian clock protein KaiC